MTLAQTLNQNSFLLIAAAVLGGAAIVLRVLHVRRVIWLLWSAALIIAVVIMLGGRSAPERMFASVTEVEQIISSGTPTLVEFFSNY